MLRTTSLITSIAVIPREWVFEYYLKLPEQLAGQDVKLHSPFNKTGDKLPSFFIYKTNDGSRYMFKDFSTDRQGDGVELVKELFGLNTRGEAAHMIITDYNAYIVKNPNAKRSTNITAPSQWRVTDFTTRSWYKHDQTYWLSYRIDSKLLAHYNVKPLLNHTLTRIHCGKEESRVMDHALTYGYFRNDGTLYKIYQPYSTVKFLKIAEYIQGTDQLLYDKDYLIICSSLKDLLDFHKLGIKNAECVAPDSENTLIPANTIALYKEKYKAICTLFDNDAAGIKSMQKYKDVYDIPFVHLNLEKDLADCVKEHGINTTRIHLYPLLTKTLTGKTKQI